MNKSLKNIIYGKKRKRLITDGLTIGGIICPLIKLNKWDVLVYGGGSDIHAIVLYFLNLGIHVKAILDCDPEKDGKMIFDEVPVINPYNIKKAFDPEKTIIIVNTWYFRGIEQYEIIKLFSELNLKKFYNLSDFELKELKADTHLWTDVGRIEYYYNHFEALQVTYDLLYDAKSKEIMLEFIRTYMECDTYKLEQCSSDIKYFYGQSTDMQREELYTHLDNEVWINAGASIGDNIFWYFANGLNAEAVYAYEADANAYTRLVKNLQYLPEKCKSKVFPVNEFIDKTTKWVTLKGRKVTLINADIEGGELNLLKSMKDIIMSCRPVLALCAYHKASDLIVLPEYIKSIVENYCFVLRKYESFSENIRRTGELVLYAIPKERVTEGIK